MPPPKKGQDQSRTSWAITTKESRKEKKGSFKGNKKKGKKKSKGK